MMFHHNHCYPASVWTFEFFSYYLTPQACRSLGIPLYKWVLYTSLRMGKVDFQIQNESDYAIGLAHGIIITGFVSHFNTYNKREPNQEELIEVSKVLSKRTAELREAVFKGE